MRVPANLASAFDTTFEQLISEFAVRHQMLPDTQSLSSNRFVSRSIVPHIHKLSSLFNREDKDQGAALDPYWKESSHPAHLRAAYFLYFMPSNLFRIASVWSELARLGYRWKAGDTFKGIEFGAGPAPGACAAAVAEKFAPIGMPESGNWALIEQDKAMLEIGKAWAETYMAAQGRPDWSVRPFHRKIALGQTRLAERTKRQIVRNSQEGLLPRSAPKFNAWIMSFFLNEFSESPLDIARQLIESWDRHLEEEGIVILIEPALKLQSRKLLEIRREILAERERQGTDWLQLLLPCLGHQACGALGEPIVEPGRELREDWCHEEVSWWRPPYFRLIDQLAELDRKTLPFSYLVFTKSRRPRSEILPALADSRSFHRLVSPSHKEGREREFFLCGEEGKRRARYRPQGEDDPARDLDRGDILGEAEIRGDTRASRIDRIKSVK